MTNYKSESLPCSGGKDARYIYNCIRLKQTVPKISPDTSELITAVSLNTADFHFLMQTSALKGGSMLSLSLIYLSVPAVFL